MEKLKNGTILQLRPLRIDGLLGEGGQGAVYKAIHTILGRPFALKQTSFSDDAAGVKAFEREARLLANLHHPALPRVSDFFKENNSHFLVMDFIPGEDLSKSLGPQGSALPVEQVLAWADQLLDALEYLHGLESPIIHRDIKPGNLKLGGDGKILLLDFGLAKQQAPDASRSVVGFTPNYAPLEQLLYQVTDQRSDLFSLGATLYHLLTNDLPAIVSERSKVVNRGKSDILEPVHEINAQVPESVSDVIWKAMAINREQRYQSATEFREALRKASQSGLPAPNVVIPPPPPPVIVTPEPETLIFGGPKRPFGDLSTTPDPPKIPATPSPFDLTRLAPSFKNSLQMEFVLIPAGNFLMGSTDADVKAAFADAKRYNSDAKREWFTDEQPQHRVTFRQPFYLGKFQVTQAEWQKVMGNNPSYFKGENLPVEQVSWDDCQEFLKKLNAKKDGYLYRLPSEAEWEYACRAGTTTPFSFGETITTDQVNYDGNYPYGKSPKGGYRQKTTPVGSFPANAWGLHDMHGNVWEWCQDTWHGTYEGAPSDGSAWEAESDNSRVMRGGSWHHSAGLCRAADRGRLAPDLRFRNFGVRVAVVAPRT